jgi:hypothetical protein
MRADARMEHSNSAPHQHAGAHLNLIAWLAAKLLPLQQKSATPEPPSGLLRSEITAEHALSLLETPSTSPQTRKKNWHVSICVYPRLSPFLIQLQNKQQYVSTF